VADDGGSSGRLRRDLGMVAPGDIRSCLTALADAEALMTKLVDYRFERGGEIKGHSLGNLLLAAMQQIQGGLDEGIQALSSVLRIRGSIAPSTMTNVNLVAELRDGTTVVGESQIGGKAPIDRISLLPRNVRANGDAVAAILSADYIVIGPGSVYTSILPNLLVEEIAAAVRASRAVKVYVCNVATEPGETDSYGVMDHIEAIARHVGWGLFQYILVNNRFAMDFSDRSLPELLHITEKEREAVRRHGIEVLMADVIDVDVPEHHHSDRLAKTLLELYQSAAASTSVVHMAGRVPG